MKRPVLQRVCATPHGVVGQLKLGGRVWWTIERERDGEFPAIPAGTYPLKLDQYHAGGYAAYEVQDVPDRSRILIHAANRETDLRGCIAPGLTLGVLEGRLAVLASRKALDQFMLEMAGEDGELVVLDPVVED